MRAASLMAVLVLTKVIGLAGHDVPLAWWSPIAYLWQDAALVLVFGGVEFMLASRRHLAWVAYAAVALYAVVNIPVMRVLSTPLTWSMWGAARGPLADSLWHDATWQNVLLLLTAAAVIVLAPLVLRRTPAFAPEHRRARRHAPLLALLAVVVALGPAASARVDTRGLDRNAWTALLATAMPRMDARPSDADWRAASWPDRTPREDLSQFRGAAAGRHIVLLSLESTAARYLGLYGADPDVMPNLSELARSAIVFDNAYAVYPESIKGLFSILCSTYPAFDSPAASYAAAPCRSLAAVLSRGGYRTGLFHSGRFVYLGMEAIIRNRGYGTLADAGDIGGHFNSSFGVDEPSTVTHVLRWIDALPADQRFFVTYLPIAGHHPYETPEPGPFPDHDELGRYRNALYYGDQSLGTLVRGLRARGLDQKTLWIVLGDHGEAFGQHDGNYGHTFHIYDENVHVPFLVAAPGLLPRQIRSRRVVSLIDTAPTVLELAGLPAPEIYQGRSMLDPEPRMALFFADYSLGMLGLRDGPMKFIHELDSGRSRLFDVDQDPQETKDLSNRYARQAARYVQDLRGWSAAQKHLLNTAR